MASSAVHWNTRCAPALGDPEALVEGLHVYTFNQVAETEAWRRDLLARLRHDPHA